MCIYTLFNFNSFFPTFFSPATTYKESIGNRDGGRRTESSSQYPSPLPYSLSLTGIVAHFPFHSFAVKSFLLFYLLWGRGWGTALLGGLRFLLIITRSGIRRSVRALANLELGITGKIRFDHRTVCWDHLRSASSSCFRAPRHMQWFALFWSSIPALVSIFLLQNGPVICGAPFLLGSLILGHCCVLVLVDLVSASRVFSPWICSQMVSLPFMCMRVSLLTYCCGYSWLSGGLFNAVTHCFGHFFLLLDNVLIILLR